MYVALHAAGRWFVWTALLFLAYQLLEDRPVAEELVAGGVIAALAALAVNRLHQRSETTYAARWSDLGRLAKVPLQIVSDTIAVGTAIARSLADRDALKGSVEQIPMQFGAEKSSYDATRRAFVAYGMSVAPNTVVCLIDRRGLFVHRLVGRMPPPSDLRWPL